MLYNLHQCLKKEKERKKDSTSANQMSIPSKMADYMILTFCHLLQMYSVAFLALQQVQSYHLLPDSQNVNLSCEQEMSILNIGLESFKI